MSEGRASATDAAVSGNCPYLPSLMQPQAYAHGCASIRLVETHISWIILTGDYAYKIKRPVNLGFVDFSTEAARQTDCDREIELNQPYCEGLYLAVVAVCRADDGTFNLKGEGTPVDWAVQMRQFADERLLAHELESGRCPLEAVVDFGASLASIHAGLTPRPIPDVAALAEDNFRILREHALPAAAAARVNAVAEWTAAMTETLGPLLASRDKESHGRACHGDLHAENVVRLAGRLCAFDCITFNDDLRDADPMNDVAFLLMDCCVRGHPAHGYGFLDGYLAASADYRGAPLVPYLAVYRAMVRAKVAALKNDPDEAARYIDWSAERAARGAGRLLLMCGVSGSGKSWLARQLAPELPTFRLATDVFRREVSAAPETRYQRSRISAVYDALLPIARALAASGEHVIVDATFLTGELRAPYLEAAQALGAEATIVHCTASQATLEARVGGRTGDPSEATVDVLHQQLGRFEPPRATEPAITFDTEHDRVEDLVRRLAVTP